MRYIKLYDDILVFTKLVDNMNFGKTALELNTTQSTVSRRIKFLEESLGFSLLERDTRNLKLTEQGMQLYFSFREQERFLIDQITRIKEDRKHNRGRFSLSLPFSLSHGLLTPLLAKFLLDYPDIRVETVYGVTDSNTFNDVDVEISAKKPKVEDSEFYLIGTRKIQAYCSPKYIQKYGLPTSIADLVSGNHVYMGVTDKNDDGVDEFIYINNAITGETTQIKNNDRQFIS
ncbi:MAG: LysR family transcriptional regulator, partial [Proteobacteria bacterium]